MRALEPWHLVFLLVPVILVFLFIVAAVAVGVRIGLRGQLRRTDDRDQPRGPQPPPSDA